MLIGGGDCALSQGSSALTHSVLILRAKSCLLSGCVRACLLWMHPPSSPFSLPPLTTGLKLLSANMLILFLSSDFHLPFFISSGVAPRLSFLTSVLFSSSSFLTVVPWLCRNFFPADYCNSLLRPSPLVPFISPHLTSLSAARLLFDVSVLYLSP